MQVKRRCCKYLPCTHVKNCHATNYRCCKLKQHVVQQVELASTYFQQIFLNLQRKHFVAWQCLKWVVIRPTTNLQRNIKARFPLGDFFRAKPLFLFSCELSTGTNQKSIQFQQSKVASREKSHLVENGLKLNEMLPVLPWTFRKKRKMLSNYRKDFT